MKFDREHALSRADALSGLCEAWGDPSPAVESVALSDAFGRITAKDVYAAYSIPVVRSSRFDGIAVKSAAFSAGVPDGSSWQRDIDYAQADTGDDFSDEFDAVVAVEDIERLENGGIRFINEQLEVEPGYGVNQRGSVVEEGSLAVPAGTRLSAQSVAALATAGQKQVDVLRKPRVAFIPTGNELLPWGSEVERGKTIDANSLLAQGMIESFGAEAVIYPIVRDEPDLLDQALDRALEEADIVLINGGSSRGEEDYNSRMLQERSTYFHHGVRAVPGRPVGTSIIDEKPVVNIPGPSRAAFLCFDWLVSGLVSYYFGIPHEGRPRVIAKVATEIKAPSFFERFVRVKLMPEGDGLCCVPVSRASSTPLTLSTTDAMLVVPMGSGGFDEGAEVEVELLRPLEVIRASWK